MSGDFEMIRNEKESNLIHFGFDFGPDGLAGTIGQPDEAWER